MAGFYDRVFAGESIHGPAQPLAVGAGGEVFDADLTPVRDESGAVVAVHMAGFEIGARLRAEAALRENEKRQAFLLRLSDELRSLGDAVEVQGVASRILGEWLGVDRVYYNEIDEERDLILVAREYARPGAVSVVGRYALSDQAWLLPGFRANEPILSGDLRSDEHVSAGAHAILEAIEAIAFVAVPLIKEGRIVAALSVTDASPRSWTAGDVELIRETAERTWAAVERARAEAALRESEERLRRFGEASTDVLWIRDARTLQWEYLTPAFEAIYGISCDEALRGANFRNWAELIVPEDRARAVDAIRRVRAGEQVVFDYRIRRPSDGAVRWLRNSDFPIPDEAGRVAKVGGTGRDVTAEREAATALAESEGRLQVLVEELQHRTRNLVAVVRSVAERTGRGAADLPDFQARFLDRLAALGRVQGLLSRLREGDRVTFDEVLESELDALGGGDGKVELDGPDGVRLRSGTVQMIAMGLHELATNAAKYGALRQEGARLRVQWRVAPGARGRPRLHVDWKESGVAMPPDGEAPRGSGQGRELIERALPYQLGAKTELEMGADGVRCRMELPVSER